MPPESETPTHLAERAAQARDAYDTAHAVAAATGDARDVTRAHQQRRAWLAADAAARRATTAQE
jgi:hypothetical protein